MNPNLDVMKLKLSSVNESLSKIKTLMKKENVEKEIKKEHFRELCKLDIVIDDLYATMNCLMFSAEDINEKIKTLEPIPEWALPLLLLYYMKNDDDSILNKKECNNEPFDIDDID